MTNRHPPYTFPQLELDYIHVHHHADDLFETRDDGCKCINSTDVPRALVYSAQRVLRASESIVQASDGPSLAQTGVSAETCCWEVTWGTESRKAGGNVAGFVCSVEHGIWTDRKPVERDGCLVPPPMRQSPRRPRHLWRHS
jgi:hypothetical protein